MSALRSKPHELKGAINDQHEQAGLTQWPTSAAQSTRGWPSMRLNTYPLPAVLPTSLLYSSLMKSVFLILKHRVNRLLTEVFTLSMTENIAALINFNETSVVIVINHIFFKNEKWP